MRVLRDLPVELVGRIRSDRVMRLPKPPRMHGVNGRPPKHGPEFRFTKPETWPEPAITTVTDTTNYGKAETQAWDRVHPRLTHRSAWLDHDGELSLVEGTLIRLKVEHLSKERDAPPVWLWSSKTGATPDDVDRFWQAFLRRFDPASAATSSSVGVVPGRRFTICTPPPGHPIFGPGPAPDRRFGVGRRPVRLPYVWCGSTLRTPCPVLLDRPGRGRDGDGGRVRAGVSGAG